MLPAGAADWLLRVTPAAGFAVQQSHPRYPQVAAAYTPTNGYYPLAPWAGFAVLCAWAAARPGRWPSTCCAGGTHEPAAPAWRARPAARHVDDMRDALHAEWTKRAPPGTAWLLLAAVALTVGRRAPRRPRPPAARPGGCADDPAKLSLTGIDLGQAVVAILAVLAISGEYGTGMIRITLAAMPRRTTVLAAKAAVLTGLVLAAGAVAVLGSLLAGRLILPGHGFTPPHGYPPLSLADGAVLRAAAGSVLYLALIALLSLGIATAVRDSAAAIGVVLGLLYLFPILGQVVTDPHLAAAPPADRAR